jgi:hypothetical protein
VNSLNPDSPPRHDRLTTSLRWLTALLMIGRRMLPGRGLH